MKYEAHWMQIYEEFLRHCRGAEANRPVFFVGAGVSMSAGLPSWAQFVNNVVKAAFNFSVSIEDLARYLRVDSWSIWLVQASLQHWRRTQPKNANFSELYKTALFGKAGELRFRPSSLHFLVVKLAQQMDVPIFTTNYDGLLEQAAKELRIPLRHRKHMPESFKNPRRKVAFGIYYLHGRLGGGLVASEYDYYKAFNHNTSIATFFKRTLSRRPCAFIGTSMKDQNINRILHDLEDDPKTHYWFTSLKSGSMAERKINDMLMKDLNVKGIYCDTDFVAMPTFFRRLLQDTTTTHAKIEIELDYDVLEKVWNDVRKWHDMFQHSNAFDEIELDVYVQDFANTTAAKISYSRVWSSRTKANIFDPRTVQIPRKWRASAGSSRLRNSPDAHVNSVTTAIDTLAPCAQIRHSWEKNLTCWAYVSFPVFDPLLAGASHVYVVKYRNQDNWLSQHFHDAALMRDFISGISTLWPLFKGQPFSADK